MIYRLAVCLITFVIFNGCAARPLPPLTSTSPASPAAAEAPAPPRSTTLAPAAGLSTDNSGSGQEGMAMGHGDHGMPAASGPGTAASYTCPMHSEVQATKPGRCPKCGMTLVPQRADHATADGGHAH